MNWFIIQGKDHLGPFTVEFIRKMYVDGQINDQSLIWYEGLDEPDTYYNLIVLSPGEKDFRPLHQLLGATVDEAIPPLPKNDNINVSAGPKKKIQKPISLNKVSVKKSGTVKKKKATSRKSKSLLRYVLASLFLILVISIPIIAYINKTSLFARPSKMSMRDFKRLVTTAKSNESEHGFAMAMAKDKSILWIATNNLNDGAVEIKLKGLPGKILGEGNIEATSASYLDKRFVTFDRFKFLEGVRLIDGYYQVDFYTLAPLHSPWVTMLSKDEKKEFKFSEKLLISSMPKEKFDKALKEMIEQQKANEHNYWGELQQKYQTLKAITTQIRESLEQIFEGPENWKAGVNHFENDYKMKFGQFFTNFVISNEQSYNSLASQSFADKVDVISSYSRLSRLAKSVGSHSMEILHELEAFQNLENKEEVKKLRHKSLGKLDAIINECNKKIIQE